MFTYTFSKREKIIILFFIVCLLAMAWYRFVYVIIEDQVSSLDEQIAEAENDYTTYQTEVLELTTMRSAIEEYEAEGYSQTTMPDYDNIDPLMDTLNSTLSSASSFSMSFDDLDDSESGTVKRGVTLSYTCDSYKDARETLESLVKGAYACSIESVYINEDSGSTDTSVSITAHLTFYENGTL